MTLALIASMAFTIGVGVGAFIWNLAIKRREQAAVQLVEDARQELISLRDKLVALKNGKVE